MHPFKECRERVLQQHYFPGTGKLVCVLTKQVSGLKAYALHRSGSVQDSHLLLLNFIY